MQSVTLAHTVSAETYGGDGAMASRGVAVSTLLSAASIPLILLLI